jgi:hypothetical protein
LAACLQPGVVATAVGLLAAAASGGLHPQDTASWLASTLAYVLAVVGVCLLQRSSLLASLRVLMRTRVALATQ